LSSGVWSVGVFSVDMDIALWPPGGVASQAFNSTLARLGIERYADDFDAYRGINQALWDAVHAGELTPGDVHVSRFEPGVATYASADVPRRRTDRLGIEDLFDDMSISTVACSTEPDLGICDLTVSFHRSGGTP
jgi:hypothetical protein